MSMLSSIDELAIEGRLYPSIILYGAEPEERMAAAMRLARLLLCEHPKERSDGCSCRHCPRLAWPAEDGTFHPDLHVLERDLRTSTSAESTRTLLRRIRLRPFEARGQVFIVAEADTLTDGAASALLKILEEPPLSAPRHFFLLCGNPEVLLATLRSRSLAVYLGSRGKDDPDSARELGELFASLLGSYMEGGSSAYLLAAAQAFFDSAQWNDPRATEPWAGVAAALVAAHRDGRLPPGSAGAVLDLAADLLDQAPQIRLRSIPAARILEGLIFQHLGPVQSQTAGCC